MHKQFQNMFVYRGDSFEVSVLWIKEIFSTEQCAWAGDKFFKFL